MSTKAIETQELPAPRAALSGLAGVQAQQGAPSRALSRPICKVTLLLAGDVAAVGIAHWMAAHFVRLYLKVPEPYLSPAHYYVFYIPFLVCMLYLFEGYRSPDLRRPEKVLALIFKGISLSFLALVCANFVFLKSSGFSRYLMGVWYVLCLFFLICARFGVRAAYGALWRKDLAQRTTLLVGSPKKLAGFRKVLSIQRYRAYRIIGMILAPGEDPPPDARASGVPVLGTLNDWEEIAARNAVQVIVIGPWTARRSSHVLIRSMLHRCQARKIDVEVPSDVFASSGFNFELDEFSGLFRFYATPRWSLALQRTLKRGMDLAIGLIGGIVTLLLTPVVGLLLKLEDGGPTFYRREFVGCDGQIHYYRKFRTMRTDADSILQRDAALKATFIQKHKLEDDPRMLRVGRFLRRYSLDEFPQFFSVLIGELTFVGPRVISSEEKGRYGALLPKLLSFKPGVTGFWQVTGRQTTTYEERIQMDMFYIDHWSVWLDLVILGKTFWKVLKAEGAY